MGYILGVIRVCCVGGPSLGLVVGFVLIVVDVTVGVNQIISKSVVRCDYLRFYIYDLQLLFLRGGQLLPGKFKSYMENIQTKTGKKPADFWDLANENGFIKEGKIVVKHGEMLEWLKTDMGLGHVQANFLILYLRLRTDDPNVSDQARKWAYETGYKEYLP